MADLSRKALIPARDDKRCMDVVSFSKVENNSTMSASIFAQRVSKLWVAGGDDGGFFGRVDREPSRKATLTEAASKQISVTPMISEDSGTEDSIDVTP